MGVVAGVAGAAASVAVGAAAVGWTPSSSFDEEQPIATSAKTRANTRITGAFLVAVVPIPRAFFHGRPAFTISDRREYTAAMGRKYKVISADGHVETPPDVFVKYIPERWKDRAPRLIHLPKGERGG